MKIMIGTETGRWTGTLIKFMIGTETGRWTGTPMKFVNMKRKTNVKQFLNGTREKMFLTYSACHTCKAGWYIGKRTSLSVLIQNQKLSLEFKKKFFNFSSTL